MKPDSQLAPSSAKARKLISKTDSASSRAKASIGEVRIIGGLWKRSKLPVLSKPGLRPTSDRVRETLFNWLGQDLSGLRCVDVFAGSGALGFEAASRGAADVLLIEQDAQLAAHLQAQAQRLKASNLRIQRGDGLMVLRNLPAHSVDLIFLDPPFAADLFSPAILAASHVITSRGAIYLEAPTLWTNEQLASSGLHIVKQSKAGAVYFHLLQPIQASAV